MWSAEADMTPEERLGYLAPAGQGRSISTNLTGCVAAWVQGHCMTTNKGASAVPISSFGRLSSHLRKSCSVTARRVLHSGLKLPLGPSFFRAIGDSFARDGKDEAVDD